MAPRKKNSGAAKIFSVLEALSMDELAAARSDRRGRSTASPAVSYSIAELLLLLVATRGAQPEMHRKAARC